MEKENLNAVPAEEMGLEKSLLTASLYGLAFNKTVEVVGHPDKQSAEGDWTAFIVALADNCFEGGLDEVDVVRWSRIYLNSLSSSELVEMTVHNVYALRKPSDLGKRPLMTQEQQMMFRLQEYVNRHYALRYNEMKMCVEYRESTGFHFDFRPIDKRTLNGITTRAELLGIKVWDSDVNRFVNSDLVPAFNPMQEYILSLDKWDGKERVEKMARRVHCDNPLWETVFHKWMLSMVHHWMHPDDDYANSLSPILVGTQGTGKSTFCKRILPPELKDYYTDSFDMSSRRNSELALTRFALINIDEFDAITQRQQVVLKHILQKSAVAVSPPHTDIVRNLRRFASFIGTTNSYDLLNDPTGSRRFLCIDVQGKIDNKSEINYPQLYAQLRKELADGKEYWLTKEEEVQLQELNQPFERHTIEEQLFITHFRAPQEGEAYEEYTTTELILLLSKISGQKISERKNVMFGKFLRSLHLPSRHSRGGTKYGVVRISTEDKKG